LFIVYINIWLMLITITIMFYILFFF